MTAYNFVGTTCLKPSLKKTVEFLDKLSLDKEEIDAYYELMAEDLQVRFGNSFMWRVTGRTYSRRRGTVNLFHILIHTAGQTVATVIHKLAHVMVALDGKKESHGPNFAKAFNVLIDNAKGLLY